MATKGAFDPIWFDRVNQAMANPTHLGDVGFTYIKQLASLQHSVHFLGFKVHWYHDATIAILLKLSILLGLY